MQSNRPNIRNKSRPVSRDPIRVPGKGSSLPRSPVKNRFSGWNDRLAGRKSVERRIRSIHGWSPPGPRFGQDVVLFGVDMLWVEWKHPPGRSKLRVRFPGCREQIISLYDARGPDIGRFDRRNPSFRAGALEISDLAEEFTPSPRKFAFARFLMERSDVFNPNVGFHDMGHDGTEWAITDCQDTRPMILLRLSAECHNPSKK